MSGLRDMSTIEQPPVERRPVETYVMEYDGGLVAEACLLYTSRCV